MKRILYSLLVCGVLLLAHQASAFSGPPGGCTPAACSNGPLANLSAENIKSGISIAGVTGSLTEGSIKKVLFAKKWDLIGAKNAINLNSVPTTCTDYKIWIFTNNSWKSIENNNGTYTYTGGASTPTIPANASAWFLNNLSINCTITLPVYNPDDAPVLTDNPMVIGWNFVERSNVMNEDGPINICPSGSDIKKIYVAEVPSSTQNTTFSAYDIDNIIIKNPFIYTLYQGAIVECAATPLTGHICHDGNFQTSCTLDAGEESFVIKRPTRNGYPICWDGHETLLASRYGCSSVTAISHYSDTGDCTDFNSIEDYTVGSSTWKVDETRCYL